MEDRIRHLEMIQGVITRLTSHSALAKGWTITLIAALFALAVRGADRSYILVAFFPVVMFWALDAYYLYQERLFRSLYDKVRQSQEVDFAMTTAVTPPERRLLWVSAAFSGTLVLFYGVASSVVVIAMIVQL